MTKNSLARAASALAILSLAACSGSGTNPASTTQQNIAASVLQYSVGTANLFGISEGLNVVVTYRQPSGALHAGDSAVAVSSPTLTISSALPTVAGSPDGFFSTVATGPAPTELGTHNITATGQAQSTPTTFGRSGGAFSLGIEPFNYGGAGSPDNITPYCVPLYDASGGCGADPNAFTAWGGPPAFDPNHDGEGTRDGKIYPTVPPQATLGVEMGIDAFSQITPVAGPYTLSISVPANNGTVTETKTAGISNPTMLPNVISPIATLDGSGGATFTAHLPAGVTEAYIQVTDVGPVNSSGSPAGASCNGSNTTQPLQGGTPTYYTMIVRPGHLSGTIGDAEGPLGAPSLCTIAQNTAANSGSATPGDTFVVQLIGVDYPLYEASPTISQAPAPAIVGAAGQSDITISPAIAETEASSGAVVSRKAMRFMSNRGR